MIVVLLCVGCLQGCALFKPPAAFPAEGGAVVAAMLEKINESGSLKEWGTKMNIDADEPGMESYATVAIGVKLVGLRGKVKANAIGTGNLSDATKDDLARSLSDPSASNSAKAAAASILIGKPVEVQPTP